MSTHRRNVNLVCVALLLIGLSGSVAISGLSNSANAQNSDDVLLISSPKVLKRMSLGYNGLIADLYWTRAVQYFGRTHAERGTGYKLLPSILNIATELDPELTVAYEYGATFLAQKPPEGAGEPREAVKLVRRGIENNPNDWHLYYTLGYIYATELKDYKSGAQAFAEGAVIPGAHPWMRVIGATMAEHGGDPELAHYMWTQMYESATENMLRDNAEKHLRAAEAQMDIAQIQQMVDQYRAESGRQPTSLAELVRPGYLFRLPKDPSGRYYRLGADGRVTVQRPEDFPFLERDEKTDPLLQLAKKSQ